MKHNERKARKYNGYTIQPAPNTIQSWIVLDSGDREICEPQYSAHSFNTLAECRRFIDGIPTDGYRIATYYYN